MITGPQNVDKIKRRFEKPPVPPKPSSIALRKGHLKIWGGGSTSVSSSHSSSVTLTKMSEDSSRDEDSTYYDTLTRGARSEDSSACDADSTYGIKPGDVKLKINQWNQTICRKSAFDQMSKFKIAG